MRQFIRQSLLSVALLACLLSLTGGTFYVPGVPVHGHTSSADGGILTAQFTLVAPTAFPAANSVSIIDIPQTYSALILDIALASSDTATRNVVVHLSRDNGSTFDTAGVYGHILTNTTLNAIANVAYIGEGSTQTAAQVTSISVLLTGYQEGGIKHGITAGRYADGLPLSMNAASESVTAVNALRITWDNTGNFDGGTYALYGVR
jgi:hypothetical protein